MNKKYNLKLDLQFRCNNSIMKFNQFDNNTSDFFMRITNGGKLIDIEKAIVVLATIKPSGKVASQFVEVKNGLIYSDLKASMKDEIGTYTAQAMLILEDERVVTDAISYEVEEDKIFSLLNDTVETTEEFTLLTDMLSRLSTIEISEEQRMINEAERILSEENRKIEEAKRVETELIRQHEEADRTKYDATRESNENIRKINEEARISSENARLENEANRIEQEANRAKAEQLRKDNYNFMIEDEERRRSEANAHKEAEVLRVQAETNRVNEEAKRRTLEQARVSAENIRVSNENTRKASEVTRQTNETQRVEAETQRQNRYNSFIADAEANANNFENYTNAAKVNEGERKSNELDRKSQEDRRVSNEAERISNENARIESEKQRVDAENLRKEKIIEIQSDYDSLKKVIIDENASANLQNQINQTNSQLEHKASKNDLNVEKARIDSFTKLAEGSTTGDAELIDARVGADGITYNNIGDAIRNQVRSINQNFMEIESNLVNNLNENIFSISLSGKQLDYNLQKVNISAGDTLRFYSKGSKCNVIAKKENDEGIILYNGLLENNFIEITVNYNIKSIGIYLYDSNSSVTLTFVSDFIYSNFDKLNNTIDKLNNTIDTLNNTLNGKVDGLYSFTSKFTEKRTGVVYSRNGGDYSISIGTSASCIVRGNSKAKITGFGWDSNYGYWLYAFFDKQGKIISYVQDHEQYVEDLEIDIPDNAYELRVNGRTDRNIASIELYCKTTSFKECYEAIKSETEQKYKILTLGDSITELGVSDRGWIKYFLEKTNCELIANVAVPGAVLSDFSDTIYDGNPLISVSSNNVLGNQVQKIINNKYESPDIIIIAIGANGGINITQSDIKNAYYNSSNELIPLIDVDRKTNAGAYRYCLDTLHTLYPNAIIFWSTPIIGFQSIRSAENAMKYYESLKIATEYTGQIIIDTIRCGINGINEKRNENGEYLIDGLHPNINGAKKIGYYIASKVKPFLGNNFIHN